jgi:alkylhydroperoxidase/carboxymuconolactone decarboxylase family protein YurZ
VATLRFVEEREAPREVLEVYGQIKAGFGAGQVPNVYKVLANNPHVLAAAVENRRRIMDEGRLDSQLKEWLAWATVTLANNAFGITIHTARLKKLGISTADILEALAVLQYFTGISTVINGLAMAEDVDPKITEALRQSP